MDAQSRFSFCSIYKKKTQILSHMLKSIRFLNYYYENMYVNEGPYLCTYRAIFTSCNIAQHIAPIYHPDIYVIFQMNFKFRYGFGPYQISFVYHFNIQETTQIPSHMLRLARFLNCYYENLRNRNFLTFPDLTMQKFTCQSFFEYYSRLKLLKFLLLLLRFILFFTYIACSVTAITL